MKNSGDSSSFLRNLKNMAIPSPLKAMAKNFGIDTNGIENAVKKAFEVLNTAENAVETMQAEISEMKTAQARIEKKLDAILEAIQCQNKIQ